MLYGCVEGCGLGCAACIAGARATGHYDPYTGEKIEGLGILPPPAYVTAPPGAFTYYKPQPVIGKGVPFLPKVGASAEEAAAPIEPAGFDWKKLFVPALIIGGVILYNRK